MSRRFVYVVGPSGAGKDSLLAWMRARLDPAAPVHWARRTITRPAEAGGEHHESVDEATFNSLRDHQTFALHWRANGLHYGVRHIELAPLAANRWVLLNGSRAYLPQAAKRFPGLTVLHITAGADTLRQRLLARGRESGQAIEARVQRSTLQAIPLGTVILNIHNDSTLESAGLQLLQRMRALDGWPEGLSPASAVSARGS